MCNDTTINTPISGSLPAPLSALDTHSRNVSPFLTFSGALAGKPCSRRDFTDVYYRNKNLALVNALKNTSLAENEHILNTTKGLMNCSTMCGVEVSTNGARIYKTGNRCRRAFCPKCNQLRQRKYRDRLIKAYNNKDTKKLFKGKYLYFITLTLKHNRNGCRSHVYLDDLKKYVRKLRRSQLWQDTFPTTPDFNNRRSAKKNPPECLRWNPKLRKQAKENYAYFQKNRSAQAELAPMPKLAWRLKRKPYKLNLSGYAQNYELTITKNGYNIHSHIFMIAPKVKRKANDIQKEFRKLWHDITGDTPRGFRFDFVRMEAGSSNELQMKSGELHGELKKKLNEIFKYTVKVGDIYKLADSKYKSELLARWIVETKGKKMITSNGFFKSEKLQLFALKSKWDSKEKEKAPEKSKHCRYFAGRLSELGFNYQTTIFYDRYERKALFNEVFLSALPDSFKEITGFSDKFDIYLNQNISPKQVEYNLDSWAKQAWLEQAKQDYIDDLCSAPEDYIEPNLRQAFFEELEKDLKEAYEITPEWIAEINAALEGKPLPDYYPDDYVQGNLFENI